MGNAKEVEAAVMLALFGIVERLRQFRTDKKDKGGQPDHDGSQREIVCALKSEMVDEIAAGNRGRQVGR